MSFTVGAIAIPSAAVGGGARMSPPPVSAIDPEGAVSAVVLWPKSAPCVPNGHRRPARSDEELGRARRPSFRTYNGPESSRHTGILPLSARTTVRAIRALVASERTGEACCGASVDAPGSCAYHGGSRDPIFLESLPSGRRSHLEN